MRRTLTRLTVGIVSFVALCGSGNASDVQTSSRLSAFELLEKVGEAQPITATFLQEILGVKLSLKRRYENIDRHDYEARNIELADSRIEYLDFRHLQRGSILVLDFGGRCLALTEAKRRFALGHSEPNRTHVSNGYVRRVSMSWGSLAFQVLDENPNCVASVTANSLDAPN